MHLTPGMPRGGRVSRRIAAVAVSTVALGGMLATGPALASAPAVTAAHGGPANHSAANHSAANHSAPLRAACPAVPSGRMRCFVLFRPQYAVNAALAAGESGHKTHPRGWGAKTLEHAYRLPVNRRSHQTVAVSIAFHTPKLAKYLKIYREHYGLPPCTAGSGCLRIVNQNGKTTPQAPSGLFSGWDVEATLDVSMISAACPHCKILVVEAKDNEDGNLAKTDDTAARLGAKVINNSYGQRENGLAMTFRQHYRHPGHTVVASSGDGGFDAANFPANLGSVTAVGGTSLARAHNKRGFTERVWNDPSLFAAGSSGCSAYVGKPAWQHDQHCPGRTVADISAIAARIPIFNAAWGGWLTVAGTSVAAPFVSGAYGLAGNAASITPRYLYQHAGHFFDVTKGNNSLVSGPPGSACDDYLCEARKGYDAPTGLGTPNGVAGF